jgi:hypothetical protein
VPAEEKKDEDNKDWGAARGRRREVSESIKL